MAKVKPIVELRMYGFVPFNISPIQSGIQFGHAVVEYQQKYKNTKQEELYDTWAAFYKTFIILNGGPTPDNVLFGMRSIKKSLEEIGIDHACFYEPDLNDALSGISFIVDEKVFNTTKYPDHDFINPKSPNYKNPDLVHDFNHWVNKVIGGTKKLQLRIFLKNFKLA